MYKSIWQLREEISNELGYTGMYFEPHLIIAQYGYDAEQAARFTQAFVSEENENFGRKPSFIVSNSTLDYMTENTKIRHQGHA